MKAEVDIFKSMIEIKLNTKELRSVFDRVNKCKHPEVSLLIYDKKDKNIVNKLKKMGLLK